MMKALCHLHRRRVLPLVCKAFAVACRGPSHLWRHLVVDAEHHVAVTGRRLRWARTSRCAYAFTAARAGPDESM